MIRVIPLLFSGESYVQGMVDIVVPLRVVELGITHPIVFQVAGRVVVIFQHQVHVPLGIDARAYPAGQLDQDVRS